jgi:hypothetical protein
VQHQLLTLDLAVALEVRRAVVEGEAAPVIRIVTLARPARSLSQSSRGWIRDPGAGW